MVGCLLWLLQAQQEPAQVTAKQHYERGRELFSRGLYEEALGELQEADRLQPSPVLAYNMALAYDKLGRCRAAIETFERFLRDSTETDTKAEVEQRIADQRQKMARHECKDDHPSTGTPAAREPAPAPQPELTPEPAEE